MIRDTLIATVKPKGLIGPLAHGISVHRRLTWTQWALNHANVTRGPHSNRGRWRPDTFPLLSDAMEIADRRGVHEVSVCGPTRGGKTLTFLVLMLARGIHEGRECLLMSSVAELAERTEGELRECMEADGDGSALWAGVVGESDCRTFTNGAVLHLAGANSRNVLRGFNAEIACLSEADTYKANLGDETGPVGQAIGRTDAYKLTRKIVRESTCSTDGNFIWNDVNSAGVHFRPFLECPSCGKPQTLLADTDDGLTPADPTNPIAGTGSGGVRWEDGSTADSARKTAFYQCPHCEGRVNSHGWPSWIRRASWRGCRGSDWSKHLSAVRDGGRPTPPEFTIPAELPSHVSFWWNALYVPWSAVGFEAVDIWKAASGSPETTPQDVINKRLSWTYEPPIAAAGAISIEQVNTRTNGVPRGVCPHGVGLVTAFIDVSARSIQWTVVAWRQGAVGFVLDYGADVVHGPTADYKNLSGAEQSAYEIALRNALESRWTAWRNGFESMDGGRRRMDVVLVDMGYHRSTDVVYQFCQTRVGWTAAKGWTAEKTSHERYFAPRPPSSSAREGSILTWIDGSGVRWAIGDHWHLRVPTDGRRLLSADVDHWKAVIHGSFLLDRKPDAPQPPGSLSLFGSDATEHMEISKHICAEQQIERTDRNGKTYMVWQKIRRENHWLDCLVGCRVASETQRFRTVPEEPAPARPRFDVAPRVEPRIERFQRPKGGDGFATG